MKCQGVIKVIMIRTICPNVLITLVDVCFESQKWNALILHCLTSRGRHLWLKSRLYRRNLLPLFLIIDLNNKFLMGLIAGFKSSINTPWRSLCKLVGDVTVAITTWFLLYLFLSITIFRSMIFMCVHEFDKLDRVLACILAILFCSQA